MAKSIFDHHYIESIARLRAAREKAGISQTDLAARIGKPQSYISKIETCERRIDFIELLTFCRAIGTSLHSVVPSEFLDLLGKEL